MQLVGRSALGRVEPDLDRLDSDRGRARPVPGSCHPPPRESRNPSSIDRTRGLTPAVPPAFAEPWLRALVVALTGDARAGSPAAHGWCSVADSVAGLRSRGPALWGSRSARRVPIDACYSTPAPGRARHRSHGSRSVDVDRVRDPGLEADRLELVIGPQGVGARAQWADHEVVALVQREAGVRSQQVVRR